MLSYTYRAKTDRGVQVCGDMLADGAETVVSTLRQKGYFPISVQRESRLAALLRSNAGLGTRVRTRDNVGNLSSWATLFTFRIEATVYVPLVTKGWP